MLCVCGRDYIGHVGNIVLVYQNLRFCYTANMKFDGIRDMIKKGRSEALESKRLELEHQSNEMAMMMHHSAWPVFDAPLEHFESDTAGFGKVLGHQEGDRHPSLLVAYLKANYPELFKQGELIALELGGMGSQLFYDLYRSGAFKKTGGATLLDTRSEETKEQDANINHDVLEANIFSLTFTDSEGNVHVGWEAVEKWVEENGRPHLIIERMVGGYVPVTEQVSREFTPNRLRLLFLHALRWYKILADEGTLLLEIPFNESDVKPMLDQLKPYVEIESSWTENKTGYVRIKKRSDSPEDLNSILR